MPEQFYTMLTNVGKAKIANASVLNTKVTFSKIAVGDSNGSYYNPTETQTTLVHEVWQGGVGNVKIDEHNSNWIVVESVIPPTTGGFMIREVGLFDDEGDLLVIAKYPETYKPTSDNGTIKELLIRIILEVSNASAVTLKIDPTIVLATKKDIEDLDNKKADKSHKHMMSDIVDFDENKFASKMHNHDDRYYKKGEMSTLYASKSHRHNVSDIDNLTPTIRTTKVNNAVQADNADKLRNMNFIWSGQAGQPLWLWGGADGTNMYVYNPANFSVANANSVAGFQFRNNNGMLEVLINGVWMSVGGQIYNRYATTAGGNQVGNIVIKPFGEPRAGIQNEYQEGQEVVIFDWHKPSKIINFSVITIEVPHYKLPDYRGIKLSNIKMYLDGILVYDVTDSKMNLFSAGGNSVEWHNRYLEVRKGFKIVGKVTKNNVGAEHPGFTLDMLYYEG